MPSDRGVSGFWLSLDKLEGDRAVIMAECGQRDGMLVFGCWVRIFCYQYQTARPITGPDHLAKICGIHIHRAKLLWQLLPQLLPRSLIQSPHGLLCRRTMETLKKHDKKQQVAGAHHAGGVGGDSYSDKKEEEKRKKSNQKKEKAQPSAAPVVPVGLDMESWEAYEKHRRENRYKVLKPDSITRLMRWLVKQPDQAAVVDQTIRNGWTGLFELKTNGSNGNGRDRHETAFERNQEKLKRWYEDHKDRPVDSGEADGLLGFDGGDLRETLD